MEQTCVLDFDEESSDDSDFRIEDHPEVSDDDDSVDSQGEGNGKCILGHTYYLSL